VLLNQKYFPGIGNWMADEILWRAALHPALPAGRAAAPPIAKKLRATIQQVTRDALRVIAGQGEKLPPDLNVHIPDTWLFNHRWEKGGVCPKTKKPLSRAEIGGRTTCWSPARQKLL
jgi:formamidopyrimidine-DNA glycosylase